mmetsp:Transcript_3655/g.4157  ORF Transcript_3655/g.4157 Transcript_3655/m.4157 type:complete len:84 (+) Transcript_3655:687-938(+)
MFQVVRFCLDRIILVTRLDARTTVVMEAAVIKRIEIQRLVVLYVFLLSAYLYVVMSLMARIDINRVGIHSIIDMSKTEVNKKT